MMWKASCFVLLGTLCTMVLARPTELDDIFTGYLKNVNLYNPERQSQIVKRRIFEQNQDESLKTVSLQSLVGDLEQNFFQSASSVGSFANQSPELAEATSTSIENHPILKRKTGDAEEDGKIIQREKGENLLGTTSNSVMETSTETVPSKETPTETIASKETPTETIASKEIGPHRIQIEHISVKPHYGDLPVVPAFQVHHTKLISATFKDSGSNPTQITITKTNIQAASAQKNSEEINGHKEDLKLQEAKKKIADHTEESHDTDQHATEQPEILGTTTTNKSAAELKETVAELKEKVAEIEAEPVILSARV
ncbi:uncharacterized protein LOC129241046 [Anastrepha obliqua]|uniref:uncharacterized protein LOC129241046 n=1 Tax=Anastrepha obliqua TaxID=95512 RepID=UPI00240A7752|nr:uncharacterized protein LOC129241046 [Anastrepha obliqua]